MYIYQCIHYVLSTLNCINTTIIIKNCFIQFILLLLLICGLVQERQMSHLDEFRIFY